MLESLDYPTEGLHSKSWDEFAASGAPVMDFVFTVCDAAAYWITASTSFANPAVTIARALTNSFSGIAPADVPVLIVAQILGALAGLGLIGWLFAASEENRRFGSINPRTPPHA